jgi:hypothetical protein
MTAGMVVHVTNLILGSDNPTDEGVDHNGDGGLAELVGKHVPGRGEQQGALSVGVVKRLEFNRGRGSGGGGGGGGGDDGGGRPRQRSARDVAVQGSCI